MKLVVKLPEYKATKVCVQFRLARLLEEEKTASEKRTIPLILLRLDKWNIAQVVSKAWPFVCQ